MHKKLLYAADLTAGLFLLSMFFWAVQMLLCRKVKQPIIRHIPQICAGIAVVLAFLFECNVFGMNPLRDFNETVASAVFHMLAAPLLLGSTAAWLFQRFCRSWKEHIVTILAGMIGIGLYQLIAVFVLRQVRLEPNLLFGGSKAVVFILLEGVNAAVWQIMNRKRRK